MQGRQAFKWVLELKKSLRIEEMAGLFLVSNQETACSDSSAAVHYGARRLARFIP